METSRFTGTWCVAGVVEQVVEGPRRDRVHLDEAVALIPGDQRRVRARGRLFAADAGEPHLVAAQRVLQRSDLAARAAQARVARVELLAELGILLGDRLLRQHVHDPHVERPADLVAGVPGLGEVVAGVQEQHVDPGQLLGDEVRQRGVGHRARDGRGIRTEVARDPRDDLGGGCLVVGEAAELDVAGLGERAQLVVRCGGWWRAGASETVIRVPPPRRGAPTGRRSRRMRHPGRRGTAARCARRSRRCLRP